MYYYDFLNWVGGDEYHHHSAMIDDMIDVVKRYTILAPQRTSSSSQ
jgi:hypothetical protein